MAEVLGYSLGTQSPSDVGQIALLTSHYTCSAEGEYEESHQLGSVCVCVCVCAKGERERNTEI